MKIKINQYCEFDEQTKKQIKDEAIKNAIRNRNIVEIIGSILIAILFMAMMALGAIGIYFENGETIFTVIAMIMLLFLLIGSREIIIQKQEIIIDLKTRIFELEKKNKEPDNDQTKTN